MSPFRPWRWSRRGQLVVFGRAAGACALLLVAGLMPVSEAAAQTVALTSPGTAPGGAVLVSDGAGRLAFAATEGRAFQRSTAVRLSQVEANGQVLQRRFRLPDRRVAYDLQVALGPNELVTAAWAEQPVSRPGQALRPSMVRAVSCDAARCGPVRTLGQSRFVAHPAVAADGSGRSVVVWRGNRGTTPRLQWRRALSSAPTSRYLPTRSVGGTGLNPVMVGLPDGGVLAAWERGGLPGPTTATLGEGASRFRLGTASFSGIPQLARAGDRAVLVTSVRDPGRQGLVVGPVVARLATQAAGRVRFSRPQVVNPLGARNASVAAAPSGEAAITFAATPDATSELLQPEVVRLAPGASTFDAPVVLFPATAPQTPYGPYTPAVGSDGTVRVLLDGRLTAASTQRCCTFDAPLLSTLSPGAQPVTAPLAGAVPPTYRDGQGFGAQSALVAGDVVALRAGDGSWTLQSLASSAATRSRQPKGTRLGGHRAK